MTLINTQLSNENIIFIVTILFSFFILLIFLLGFYAYKKTSKGGAMSYRQLFSSNFYRLFLILFIIYSITILKIIDKADNQIITLFSSLAGFIIGGMKYEKKEKEEDTEEKK